MIKLREQILQVDAPDLGLSLGALGLTLVNKGKYEEANNLYHKALTIFIKASGENHSHTKCIRERIASL